MKKFSEILKEAGLKWSGVSYKVDSSYNIKKVIDQLWDVVEDDKNEFVTVSDIVENKSSKFPEIIISSLNPMDAGSWDKLRTLIVKRVRAVSFNSYIS